MILSILILKFTELIRPAEQLDTAFARRHAAQVGPESEGPGNPELYEVVIMFYQQKMVILHDFNQQNHRKIKITHQQIWWCPSF